MTAIQFLESNADNVALNLVYDAIIDNVDKPGDAIAELLERMSTMARDVGGAHRACNTDWNGQMTGLMGDGLVNEEIEPLVKRMVLTTGDTLAKYWMLANMARHLCELLESHCENDPYAAHIESIEYDTDGTVIAWSQRSDSGQ